ncbi:MAG: polysaccharide biosynthesis/export family protein [Janthinobacterium lividum]
MKKTLSVLSLACLFLSGTAGAQAGSRPVLTAAPQAPAQTSAPAASPGKNGASMALSPEYRIGAYDLLQVTVWKELQLSGSFPVRPDGMISLVLLGDVPAAGVTPMQLGQNITEALKKYIQDPLVTVTVAAVNSQKVYVVGQVGHVGPIDLSPGMTPLEAIAAAGGLTTYANGKNCYILRGPAGQQKKLPFDYKKALKGKPDQAITLQTGDTVVIP